MDTQAAAAEAGPTRASRFGLSGKLLVLTILFVMIAEVLIYVPSIANFRLNWLQDRISSAYTAALVLEATPNVPETLTKQILDSIGARAVALKMGQQRRLLAVSDMPPAVDHEIDMRNVSWYRAIINAF
ncbi:MAG: sensor histidine kinase, partial [Xanthobacteraceae bacterium]